MFEMIVFALRNITRNFKRTLLIILGITIGVCSVVIINSISQTGKIAVNNELNYLGLNGVIITTNPENYQNSIGKNELEIISANSNIEYCMPFIMTLGEISLRDITEQSLILGVDNGAENIIKQDFIYGRNIQKEDILSKNLICVIDKSTSIKYFNRENSIGENLTISSAFGTYNLKVVGVTKTGSGLTQNMLGEYVPNIVYIPYNLFGQTMGFDNYQSILLKVNENSDVNQVTDDIISSLNLNSGNKDDYISKNLSQEKKTLDSLLNIITVALTSIGAISLLVSTLNIMTMTFVSVSERTKEIGIKKSIGAKSSIILLEFIIEAGFISLIGGVVGSIFSFILLTTVSYVISYTITIDISVMALVIVCTTIIGMIFSIYPSSKAANLKPVEALQ